MSVVVALGMGSLGLPEAGRSRVVRSRTNQDYYYRCERSTADARYPKYPRLPVLRCDGYDPVEPRPSREPVPPATPTAGAGRAPGGHPPARSAATVSAAQPARKRTPPIRGDGAPS